MTGGIGALAAGVAGGAAFGTIYLALVWAGARALTGSGSAARFAALAALRSALLVGALAGAALLGAGAGTLLAALAGFTLIRMAATRRMARGADGERGTGWR